MIRRLLYGTLLVATAVGAVSGTEPGLVARYTFDEGAGAVLKDHSGNGHHGTIRGAAWVRSPRGHALAFGRTGSYVDCGLELARKLTADMTLLAWVRLSPAAYPDGTTNWTIVDCEEYTRSGFIVRVDGQATKLYYRASLAGRAADCFSKATVASGVYHHVAVVRRGNRAQVFVDGLPEPKWLAPRCFGWSGGAGRGGRHSPR